MQKVAALQNHGRPLCAGVATDLAQSLITTLGTPEVLRLAPDPQHGCPQSQT
jgi:hypothetical protein